MHTGGYNLGFKAVGEKFTLHLHLMPNLKVPGLSTTFLLFRFIFLEHLMFHIWIRNSQWDNSVCLKTERWIEYWDVNDKKLQIHKENCIDGVLTIRTLCMPLLGQLNWEERYGCGMQCAWNIIRNLWRPQEKKWLRKYGCRRYYNTEIEIRERECKGVSWIHLD